MKLTVRATYREFKERKMLMKHKIIKARIKEERGALTCAEMLDGRMKIGKEMTTALVEWNRQHSQQLKRNGATTVNGEAFSKGLRPHLTTIEELHNNTRAILEGTFDRKLLQNHELPFYDALRSTTSEVLEMISEELTEKEFLNY